MQVKQNMVAAMYAYGDTDSDDDVEDEQPPFGALGYVVCGERVGP